MKHILTFYTPETENTSIILSEENHGKVFKELSSGVESLLKNWVVQAIEEFVYIRNINTPEYEEGRITNERFKNKAASYLLNLGKNAGEIIEYYFLPSEYMDITYTVPIENNDIIKVEIGGYRGDCGKLNVENREFSLHISQKNVGNRSYLRYLDNNIYIRKKLIREGERPEFKYLDVNLFKKIYKNIFILSLSEFLYSNMEEYRERLIGKLADVEKVQKERRKLLEENGLKARGVKDEN